MQLSRKQKTRAIARYDYRFVHIDLFIEEPSLIRRPIIMDDRRLQIGFNDEEIRMFLPREIRDVGLLEIHKQLAAESA